MKIISIKRKTILKVSVVLMFLIGISIFTKSFSMQNYYNVGFSTGLVTASELNVRSGPGTWYGIVAKVKRNEYIRVFAGVGDWYIVQVEGDYVGAVSKKYVKAIYPTLEQAKQYFSEGDRWVEFNYGLVDFDWYEANEFREIKHKKKKKKS